jgi:DNA mismatch repair ATPase MutS
LRAIVIEHSGTVQHNAELVDELDVSAGFGQAAVELNYVRPVLDAG